MTTADHINRLTNRHIAKLLNRLGDTAAPVMQSEIKRQMRFLSQDILEQVINNKEISEHERNTDR